MPVRDSTELWLFSYGTLRLPEVQFALFGRAVESCPDCLSGFLLATVAIDDPEIVALSGSAEHPILQWTGNAADQVEGAALRVTERDLAQADAYESNDYVRTAVTLRSGRVAFVYVGRDGRALQPGACDL